MREIYKDKDGKLLFRKSFCAYIDILGFSEKIIKNDLTFFNSYLTTLTEELKHIEYMHDLSGKEGMKSFELKIFTDNFVFGHPWFDVYGESELGNIFEVLSHIQYTFVKSKIFVRGAISVSDLYMDENIVLGPALIESYKLESEKAIYPRIILSNEVVDIVKIHINYYSDKKYSPQNKEYLVDIDGFHFINYLFIMFYDHEHPTEYILKEITEHKNVVEECLASHIDNYKLFDKYSWVAKYHNYFCKTFITYYQPEINLDKILIEKSKYSRNINQII